MKIIGITGTNSAGKGAVVEYLKQKGFVHFSVRAFLNEEIKKRGLPVNRESMHFVANDLRKEHSPRYIIETLLLQAKILNENCVIESIRTPAEMEFLKAQGNFYLIAVDADPELRYKRARERKSESDNVTYEQFVFEEEREMRATDPNKQNVSECVKQANFIIMNNGTKEGLHKAIDKIIPQILKDK